MATTLVAGTVVQLKSGGPIMVVTDAPSDGSRRTYCEWLECGEKQRGAFDSAYLVPYSAETAQVQ